MNIFNTETGQNLGQIEDIKSVSIDAKYKTDYAKKDIHKVLSYKHDTTYEFTFNADKPIDTKEFYKILGIDIANMPDTYDIQFVKYVQARKHRKRRINKKWLKQYGYKQTLVESKGWKMKSNTNGNVEFIK